MPSSVVKEMFFAGPVGFSTFHLGVSDFDWLYAVFTNRAINKRQTLFILLDMDTNISFY